MFHHSAAWSLTCLHLLRASSVSAPQMLGLPVSCRLHQAFCQTGGTHCLLYGLERQGHFLVWAPFLAPSTQFLPLRTPGFSVPSPSQPQHSWFPWAGLIFVGHGHVRPAGVEIALQRHPLLAHNSECFICWVSFCIVCFCFGFISVCFPPFGLFSACPFTLRLLVGFSNGPVALVYAFSARFSFFL